MALVDMDQFAHQKNETNNNARNDEVQPMSVIGKSPT